MRSGQESTSVRSGRVADIFVPGIGQFENIGDIILRRQLLRWLRPLGRLHVYVGHSIPGYDQALELSGNDHVYHSFGSWYRAGLSAALGGTGAYFFKPGEIQMSLPGLKEHVSMVPLLALLRLRGRPVMRVGSGSRNFAPLPRLAMWPSLALAQRTWWRDPQTAAYLGHGGVMPDLAFGEGDDVVRVGAAPERDTLVVSMRGDREPVHQRWIDGVRRVADERGLRIVAVTQVLRDEATSQALARALGGTCIGWTGGDHHGKEQELRDLYRRTRLAVSDRLHVLIAAFTNGAVPVALQCHGSDKIARHFEAIGVRGLLTDSTGMSVEEIASWVSKNLERDEELDAALQRARQELGKVRQEIERCLSMS
ncbi:MAG: polysaccharide pyruvyl transferase family protein [Rubrivivax sp.]|nr:MAG: polysaccharide pyruvyl transferase family protein [Rubrivivax sp.]